LRCHRLLLNPLLKWIGHTTALLSSVEWYTTYPTPSIFYLDANATAEENKSYVTHFIFVIETRIAKYIIDPTAQQFG